MFIGPIRKTLDLYILITNYEETREKKNQNKN